MVCMYHSFLIHLSAGGHLGCFHVLALINSAVMNTGVHMSLSDLVSSVCMSWAFYLLNISSHSPLPSKVGREVMAHLQVKVGPCLVSPVPGSHPSIYFHNRFHVNFKDTVMTSPLPAKHPSLPCPQLWLSDFFNICPLSHALRISLHPCFQEHLL